MVGSGSAPGEGRCLPRLLRLAGVCGAFSMQPEKFFRCRPHSASKQPMFERAKAREFRLFWRRKEYGLHRIEFPDCMRSAAKFPASLKSRYKHLPFLGTEPLLETSR